MIIVLWTIFGLVDDVFSGFDPVQFLVPSAINSKGSKIWLVIAHVFIVKFVQPFQNMGIGVV